MKLPIHIHAQSYSYNLLEVTPKTYNDEQSVDADGVPKWNVEVMMKDTIEGNRDAVKIVVASTQEPLKNVNEFTPLSFKGLQVRHWEMQGRNGLSVSAVSVSADSKAAA